jgi:hypothetical protein
MDMMRISSLFVLVLIFPFCAPARAADFRDWTVGCDNIKGCTAIGFAREGQDGGGFIRVERAGGPDGQPKIRLFLYPEDAKKESALRLTADGAPIAGVAAEREARTGQDVDRYAIEISPQELKPFIAALRKSQALNLATLDGTSKVDISLAGAVAALRNIDDIQGRIGTQTALIDVGYKPASAVPDAPPLPVIVPAIAPPGLKENPALAVKLRKRIAKENPDGCEDLPEGGAVADEATPLNKTQTLVELACSSGAYNFGSDFWIVTSGDVARAVPASFKAPGQKPANSLFDADFDRKTATLSFFYKGRGVGDCGDAGKYVWTGKGFAILEYSAMVACRGIFSDDWLVLWRARLK